MIHVPVEANLWYTGDAVKLGRLMGDPDSWRFLVRLWAWGLLEECESGVFDLPATEIAHICGHTGDPEKLVNSLLECEYLQRKADGFYMRGWSRNHRFFSERARKREFARRLRGVPGKSRATSRAMCCVSQSRSRSRSLTSTLRRLSAEFSHLDQINSELGRYGSGRGAIEEFMGVLVAGHKVKNPPDALSFLTEWSGYPAQQVVAAARDFQTWPAKFTVNLKAVRTFMQNKIGAAQATTPTPEPLKTYDPRGNPK